MIHWLSSFIFDAVKEETFCALIMAAQSKVTSIEIALLLLDLLNKCDRFPHDFLKKEIGDIPEKLNLFRKNLDSYQRQHLHAHVNIISAVKRTLNL